MCTPLPTRSGSGFGEKMTRCPSLCAAARVIGRRQRRLRHHRHLELARAVLGEEGVRTHPGRPQGRNETLAESNLPEEGAEGVGVTRPVGRTGVDDFLLEGGDQAKACCVFELSHGAAQEITRAAFPSAAIGIADIAHEEMLNRRSVAEIDPNLDRRVGHDHEISSGAERGVPDRPKRRHHQIAAGPTNALLEPQWKLACREPLAPREARDVAGRDENEFFPDHAPAYAERSMKTATRMSIPLGIRSMSDRMP